MTKSELEHKFLDYWLLLAPDCLCPQLEYRFHDVRRFRFDFAWPEKLVAVELEGGTWIRGAHTRGKRYASDCQKYNLAASLGWSVYRFTTDMLDRDPAGCVAQVKAALGGDEELPFAELPRKRFVSGRQVLEQYVPDYEDDEVDMDWEMSPAYEATP